MLAKPKTPEQQELEVIGLQITKLIRKIESHIDPFNDMLEAVKILQNVVVKRLGAQSELIIVLRTEIGDLQADKEKLEKLVEDQNKLIEELNKEKEVVTVKPIPDTVGPTPPPTG